MLCRYTLTNLQHNYNTMALITETTEYSVSFKKRYVMAVSGYTDQTTHVEYLQNDAWIPIAKSRKTENWAERSLQPVTDKIRIVYDAGSDPLDVELSPLD